MRAIVIPKHGPPEVFEEREIEERRLTPQDVRIRVEAAGVNFADLMGRVGLYPDAPALPYAPGYEVAGTVVADTGIDIEKIRFRYRIEGDAPWKPRQVFDDGAKVYIQFPSGLAQSEAPPLFVIGPDAKPALVNYRVRGTTYIVDRLFAAAELRLGTAPQQVVRIVRTDAVWREVTQ